MYIEDRLFSGASGERYYSVTMTEEEYSLFSEFQKEFASIRKAKKVVRAINEGERKIGLYNSAMERNGLCNSNIYNSPRAIQKITAPSPKTIKRLRKEADEVYRKEGLEGSMRELIESGKKIEGYLKRLS